MSVVAARIVDGKAEMSYDAGAINTGEKERLATVTPKVFIPAADLMIGSVGEWRPAQILEFTSGWPSPTEVLSTSMRTWMHNYLVPFLIKAKNESSAEDIDQFNRSVLLVAPKDRIFRVYTKSMQVIESIQDYDAIGSGRHHALGALFAGATTARAVEAACQFCLDITGPVKTIKG